MQVTFTRTRERRRMQRSEKLVDLCVSEWERRNSHRAALPTAVDTDVATAVEVAQAVMRLDDAHVASRPDLQPG